MLCDNNNNNDDDYYDDLGLLSDTSPVTIHRRSGRQVTTAVLVVVATYVADCGWYVRHARRGIVNINTYGRLHFADVRCVTRRVVPIADRHAVSTEVSRAPCQQQYQQQRST